MACGCSGKKRIQRSSLGPRRSVRGNTTVRKTAQQIEALSMKANEKINAAGLNAERRRIERLRREAVRRALGK